jgi:glycosyltransferase involved in cell wall biosynthesis
LEYLEQAVKGIEGIELRIVSNAFGEEKEKVWDWCDVLVLPTLSENFGLVVAEALERGKRVITTDGAPVWGEESGGVGEWRSDGVESRYGGRLLYLKGFRDGSDEERVRLLKEAVSMLSGDVMIKSLQGV